MHLESDRHDDFSDLEQALKALRPSALSAELESRVFAIFDEAVAAEPEKVIAFPEARPDNILSWFRPIAAAAAVAAVFLGGIWMLRDPEPASKPTAELIPVPVDGDYQPVSAGPVFEKATDEGVVYPNARNEPMRRVRYQYHDTYEWRHPDDGSRIRLSVPHEETLYLPVETD